MEPTLSEILLEIKSLRTDMYRGLKEQKEEIIALMDKRLKEQMDNRFNQQSKEIAQEFRNIVTYFESKNGSVEKQMKELKKDFKRNKADHESYNAKIYKMELGQSYLEEKIREKEEVKVNQ